MSRLSRLTRSFTAPTIDSSTTNIIVEHRVPIVITSLGARPEINDAVHSYGGIVLHDVTNNEFARKAIDKGADGIIAVAAGAGGHAGTQSPLALIREIGEWFDGPLLLSGAIAHGRSILAAVAAGADFAYIGSAFLRRSKRIPQRIQFRDGGPTQMVKSRPWQLTKRRRRYPELGRRAVLNRRW